MNDLFPQLESHAAPEQSKGLLKEVEADFGMIPNLEKTLASSPPTLEAYVRLWALFDQTSLSPIERQVVYQTANYSNNCSYCVPWHTLLSKDVGMADADIESLRKGLPLSDPRLESLRLFAKKLIEHQGHPPAEDLESFFEAGFTSAQAMEVILGLAVKLISNYTNGIADTPLDEQVKSLAWKKP